MANTIKLKKLIKELDDEFFYLSLYINNKRVYGDFAYNADSTLKEYLDYEVLDITPSDTSKIIKVYIEKKEKEATVETPKKEVKEDLGNGKKRRNTTSRKSVKVS